MYRKPNKDEIAFAVEQGWSEEDAQRGYAVFDFDSTGCLEINRIEDVFAGTEVTDEDCARQAELDGYCKIIPVDELPANMDYDGNSRRYFGWVDTPENRQAISDFYKDQNREAAPAVEAVQQLAERITDFMRNELPETWAYETEGTSEAEVNANLIESLSCKEGISPAVSVVMYLKDMELAVEGQAAETAKALIQDTEQRITAVVGAETLNLLPEYGTDIAEFEGISPAEAIRSELKTDEGRARLIAEIAKQEGVFRNPNMSRVKCDIAKLSEYQMKQDGRLPNIEILSDFISMDTVLEQAKNAVDLQKDACAPFVKIGNWSAESAILDDNVTGHHILEMFLSKYADDPDMNTNAARLVIDLDTKEASIDMTDEALKPYYEQTVIHIEQQLRGIAESFGVTDENRLNIMYPEDFVEIESIDIEGKHEDFVNRITLDIDSETLPLLMERAQHLSATNGVDGMKIDNRGSYTGMMEFVTSTPEKLYGEVYLEMNDGNADLRLSVPAVHVDVKIPLTPTEQLTLNAEAREYYHDHAPADRSYNAPPSEQLYDFMVRNNFILTQEEGGTFSVYENEHGKIELAESGLESIEEILTAVSADADKFSDVDPADVTALYEENNKACVFPQHGGKEDME